MLFNDGYRSQLPNVSFMMRFDLADSDHLVLLIDCDDKTPPIQIHGIDPNGMDQAFNGRCIYLTCRTKDITAHLITTLLYQPCCNNDNKSRNKPVDQDWPDERPGPVGNPAKGKTTKDRGECFHFRLAEMSQCKRDCLQPQRLRVRTCADSQTGSSPGRKTPSRSGPERLSMAGRR